MRVTRKEGLVRLSMLAEYLLTLDERRKKDALIPRFNIRYWKQVNNYCGTSACAVGHAIEAFPQWGLEWDKNSVFCTPYRDGLMAMRSAMSTFAMSCSEMEHLFFVDDYLPLKDHEITAEVVAAQIQKFVEKETVNASIDSTT